MIRDQVGNQVIDARSEGRSPTDNPGTPERDDPHNIRLQPWEEVVGRIRFVEEREFQFVVGLAGGSVIFPLGSAEAAIVGEQLEDANGELVSILRTGLDDPPIVVSKNT